MTAWFVISVLLVGSLALAAYCVGRIQREPREFEEFRAAVAELEAVVGSALLPVLRRFSDEVERWRRGA